jgi:hypothetical protein
MKTYEIYWSYTVYGMTEIEASNEKEANEIFDNADCDDFNFKSDELDSSIYQRDATEEKEEEGSKDHE